MSENCNHGNNDGEVIIDVKNLHKNYGHMEVIKGVDLTVRKGEVICIIGPSGAGKSTMLRCLNGLEQASSGQIVVNGHDLGDPHVNIDQVREQVGMVFQHFNLFNNMSVIDNITLAPKLVHKETDEQAREHAMALLKTVGLAEKADAMPRSLSGGQKQRVAIGSAIIRQPKAFLMDEPLSNLDAKLRSDMRTELIQLHEELKSTFVYVTHDQIEAMTMGTNIVVMNEGRVMQQGSPTEIHNDPNCVFVAQFVGDPGMNIVAAGDYQVGFRPRDVEFDCADRDEEHVVIHRRVRSFENHGSEFLYLLDTPEKVFVKELSKRQRPLNEPFTVRIHRDDLYVFGRDGKRIYASEEVAKAYAEFKRNWQSV